MRNEDELHFEFIRSLLSSEEKSTAIAPPQGVTKFTVMLATLNDITRHYPIQNATDFFVETLFKEAKIKLKPSLTNCLLETCGARGPEFCTLFLNASETVVAELIEWFNTFYPSLVAKSLRDIPDAEKNTDELTVISVGHETDITLHIDSLVKNFFPLVTANLTCDKNNRMKFAYLKKIRTIIIMLQDDQEDNNTTRTNALIRLLQDLLAHVTQHGLSNERHELKGQLQNINNEQDGMLIDMIDAKQGQAFFSSLKKSVLQKISLIITETLLDICKKAHITILVNDNTQRKFLG